jgi:hypothetical protein
MKTETGKSVPGLARRCSLLVEVEVPGEISLAELVGSHAGNAAKDLVEGPGTGKSTGLGDLMELELLFIQEHVFCAFHARLHDVFAGRAAQTLEEVEFQGPTGNIEFPR